MRLRERLADGAEHIVRRPRVAQVRQLLVGYPLIGAVLGVAANGVAHLVCRTPTPVEFVIATFLVVVAPQVFDKIVKTFEEPIGDLVNRALTRVFNFPWIPFESRPRLVSDLEPHQTTVMACILLLTVANSEATSISLFIWGSSTWIPSLICGAAIMVLRGLAMKQTWDQLLLRQRVRS